jgi:hypothetical protein
LRSAAATPPRNDGQNEKAKDQFILAIGGGDPASRVSNASRIERPIKIVGEHPDCHRYHENNHR